MRPFNHDERSINTLHLGVREMTTTILREEQHVSSRPGQGQEGKHLTFNLGEGGYGINILRIKEIIGMMTVTAMPQMPDYIKGVINLRGKVISIIDLRLRFGMAPAAYTERTCIIVVQIESHDKGSVQMGIVVDSVSEVLTIKAEDIELPPDFADNAVQPSFIQGLAKINGSVKILLDINRILRGDELQTLEEIAG